MRSFYPRPPSWQLCTLAPIMLTVGNKMSFMMSPWEEKFLLWHLNNESKNNNAASANKQLQSQPQTPKSQSAFLLFHVKELARKKREHNFETMKNEKQSSGTGSRPHETELTTAAVCLELQREGFQDHTVAVKWDTRCCKVIFLWPSEPENDTYIFNKSREHLVPCNSSYN